MTITELDAYFRNLLSIDDFNDKDPSQNGLQVTCSNKQIKKIAFAVDACVETFNKAIHVGADLVFVHHGLFWRHSTLITGTHYERIKLLLENDIALYAVHLPLDAHKKYGNNIGIAQKLELQNIQPFGWYHGIQIGVKGSFTSNIVHNTGNGICVEEILTRLFQNDEKPNAVLPFGKKQLNTVGIISGMAGDDLFQAISENLDCYITGEINHSLYHEALENKITVIAGGHYQTETFGVNLVSKQVKKDLNIETIFLSTPTYL